MSGAQLPSYFDGGAAGRASPPLPAPPQVDHMQQEKEILTQEVSQAFYHLVDAQKRATGGTGEVSFAGQQAEDKPGPATLTARGGAAAQRPRENFMMRQAQDGSHPHGTGLGGFKLEFTSGYITFIPELTLLFLSCLLPVLAVSGRNVMATLLVGVLATYMFDYTNQRKLALLSVWCCVGTVWAGLCLTNAAALSSGGWLQSFIIMNITLYLFLLGLFATIQFRWLQLTYPEVALATERVLLGLTPITLLPLIFSSIVSFVGSEVAPFFFAAVLCGLHRTFYTLRKSAFKDALVPEARWEEYINGKVEAVLFSCATVGLPVLVYVLTNHKDKWYHVLFVLNAATLLAGPAFYLFYKPEQNLWFLYRDPYAEKKGPEDVHWLISIKRVVILMLAYSAVLHWLIYRVAFGRFAYILSGVPPPWNVMLIAMAAYAGSIVLYCAIDLAENQERNTARAVKWSLVLLCSMVGAAAVTYVAGMPRFIIMCSALSASCLTNFVLDPRNVNNYILFVCTTFVLLIWWMYKSFSFLRIELPILGGAEYVSLPQLAVYVLWLYLIQCMIFPLGIGKADKAFFISLLQQVCALAMLEHVLYSQEENFYPAYCVLGTTCWGMYCAYTLHKNKRVTQIQAAVLIGLYVAKLYLFAMVSTLPAADSELFKAAYGHFSLISAFLCVAVMATVAVQLYWEKKEKKRRSSFKRIATVYLVAAVVTALLSRNSIVLALMELTTGDAVVQTGRLFGLVLLYAGMLQLPLTTVLPASQSKPAKICQGFIAVGAVVALLDPAFESTEETGLDMDLYDPPGWAPYLGVLSVALVGVTLLNVVSLPDHTALRVGWWTSLAAGCGMAFTASFIPYPTWHTYLLIVLVFGLVVLCIEFAHYNVAAQEEASNSVWGLYSGALVALLATLMDAQWRVPAGFDENLRLETATMRQNAVLCLTVGINLILAVLIKLKLSDRPALKPRSLAKMDSLREMLGDGSHFGLLANICVVQAYLSLLMLKSDIGTGSPGFPVLISPLLLLMHDDGWLFVGLADADQLARYVPPLAVSAATLSWRAMWVELPGLLHHTPMGFALQLTVFLLAAAFAVSAAYDLWIDSAQRRRDSGTEVYAVAVCVVLFLLAGTEAIRLLAGVTLIACVLPLFNDSAWARKLDAVL